MRFFDSDDDGYVSGLTHFNSGYARIAVSTDPSSLNVAQAAPLSSANLPVWTRSSGSPAGLSAPAAQNSVAFTQAAAAAQFADAFAAMKSGPLSVLDTQLAALYYANSAQAASMQAFVAGVGHNSNALTDVGGTEFVTIDAVAKDGDGAALLAQLQHIGLQGGASIAGIASGRLAVDKVADLLNVSDLSFARESSMGTRIGSVTTQADSAQHNDTARTTYGVDGTGVKIGVLSDSFNNTAPGGDDMAYDIAHGDLPAATTILAEYTGSDGADEGRGMAQLIHDLAPGASIEFATAFSGIAGFASNIMALAAGGAKVIVDDVFYFAELYYQQDAISQAVSAVAASGVAYFSAAGNQGTKGYEGYWVGGAPKTIGTSLGGSKTETFMQFAPGQDYLKLDLRFTDHFVLQWDQPAASAGPGNPGATGDLDLFITNAAGDVIYQQAIANNTGQDPVEIIDLSSFHNGEAAGTENYIRVGLASGAAPTEIKLLWYNNNVNANIASNFNNGTVVGHSAAPGAIGVGAAPYYGTPEYGTTPPAVEDFSSGGPLYYWYDTSGARYTIAVRAGAPQIVGVDAGNTTFFGADSDGDGFPNFFGTSAAAPDVAAIAALMLQLHPELTPADILARLERTAIDMDDPMTPGFDVGYDPRTGYGLVNANDAINFQSVNQPPVINLQGAALSYTENAAAAVIAPSTTITDPDSTDFNGGGLTVAVTGSVATDQLTIQNQGIGAGQIGVSGSDVTYAGVTIGTFAGGTNGADLVITFTSATPAIAQALARAIEYASTSDNPAASRTVTFTIDDGHADAHTAFDTATVNITAENDAPVITAAGTITAATPGIAIAVDPNIVVSDPDNATLASATVQITGHFVQAEDLLAFTNNNATTFGDITASYDGSSGTLTLTSAGASTMAQWQAALRAVTYIDNGGAPDTATRTVTFIANDGSDPSFGTTQQITLDGPILAAASGSPSFTENGSAAVLASAITVADASSATIDSATISISAGFFAGDTLNFTNTANITGSYDSGTGILTLTGSDTLAAYQTALRSITFSTASENPDNYSADTTRTIRFVINDGAVDSNTASTTLSITAVNDVPTLTNAGTGSYTEGGPNGTIHGTIVVADADDQTLQSATITITSGFTTGDVLAFTDQNGITGQYDPSLHKLTLFGTASVATYQDALRSIGFASTSNDPTGTSATRTVTFTVNDGHGDSAGRTSTVTITPVNNAPTLAATAANPTFTEANGLGAQAAGVTVFSSAATGTIEANQKITSFTFTVSGLADGSHEVVFVDGTAISLGGNSSGSTSGSGAPLGYNVTVSGGTATVVLITGGYTPSVINAHINGIKYQNTLTDTPTDGDRFFTLTQIVDNGGTANGGHDTTTVNIASTVHVSSVDDAAVAKDDAFTTDEATAIGAGLSLFNNNGSGADSDIDGPALSIASVTGGTLGTQFTLASGAKLTVNANGTFSYDPNHAFDDLAGPGHGAADTAATDSFSYTLTNGGTATATITINGLDGAGTVYTGGAGDDSITGDPAAANLFHLEQGGNDTATGGSGNDGFYFGGAFNGSDTVHGGAGSNDQIGLEGDYSGGVTLDGSKVDGVEVLAMMPGFNYQLTTLDNFVGAGQTFVFWAASMGPANHVTIDGHLETDGKFQFYLGQGNDTAIGGAGNDLFYGDGGADTLTGNGGSDKFSYLSVAASNGADGTAYDTLDFTAGTDRIKLTGTTVTAIDAAASGSLSAASFDADLAAVLGNGQAHQLNQGHAVVFTVTAGAAELLNHVFLVVGTAGAATGYTAGNDYVFDVTAGNTTGLATTDFI